MEHSDSKLPSATPTTSPGLTSNRTEVSLSGHSDSLSTTEHHRTSSSPTPTASSWTSRSQRQRQQVTVQLRRRRTKREKETNLISSSASSSLDITTASSSKNNHRCHNNTRSFFFRWSSLLKRTTTQPSKMEYPNHTRATNSHNRNTSNNHPHPMKTFRMFPKLTDDLKIYIIAFVADAPFELFGRSDDDDYLSGISRQDRTNHSRRRQQQQRGNQNHHNGYDNTKIGTWYSSLTHTLPYVNHEFYTICSQADAFWQAAFYRMLEKKESQLWQDQIRRIFPSLANEEAGKNGGSSATTTATHNTNSSSMLLPNDSEKSRRFCNNGRQLSNQNENENMDWMDRISALLLVNQSTNSSSDDNENTETSTNTIQPRSYKELYQHMLNRRLRHTGPVFCMPANVKLGQAYGLHLFEPRYRLLIADVLRHVPPEYKQGRKHLMEGNYFVSFIHANYTPIVDNETLASLVQVVRCEIYDDGRADVLLLPIQHVWLEHLWYRPDSGHLIYAQCRKLGKNEVHAIQSS
jgi:hypothetical protein